MHDERTLMPETPRVRVNPNGFLYMFTWWPRPLKYDGIVFAYSWLGFWWKRDCSKEWKAYEDYLNSFEDADDHT